MIRRLAILAHCLLLAVLANASIACAEDTVPSVYAAARQEGKVVFLTSADVKVVAAMAAKFNELYPGIAVEAFKIEPGPAIERIITEASAGRISVDDVDTPLSYLPQLFDRDLVAPYPWSKVFGIAPERVLFDRGIVQHTLDVPIVYNTNLVKPEEIKSWEDLTTPRWRGKVLLEARGLPFQLLAAKWGEAKTFDYLDRLLANQPIIIKGGTPTIEALAGGQGSVAIGTYGGRAIQYKELGAPVEWARVGPIPAMIYVVLPIKGSPHPNAARLWDAFWVTKEAQDAFWDGHRFGMMVGDALSPHGQEVEDAGLDIVLETTDIAENRRLLEKAGRAIGGLN